MRTITSIFLLSLVIFVPVAKSLDNPLKRRLSLPEVNRRDVGPGALDARESFHSMLEGLLAKGAADDGKYGNSIQVSGGVTRLKVENEAESIECTSTLKLPRVNPAVPEFIVRCVFNLINKNEIAPSVDPDSLPGILYDLTDGEALLSYDGFLACSKNDRGFYSCRVRI